MEKIRLLSKALCFLLVGFLSLGNSWMTNAMENVHHQENEPTICSLSYQPKVTVNDLLYPVPDPAPDQYLRVSSIHELWYSVYGNKEGIPIVAVHGGPGAGCGPDIMRFCDPAVYRIVLFEQRGTMRSKPLADMRENTTQDLVADMEKLREHLGINKWILFGGSWGTTLSLVYGEHYPERCLGFVLRGIFLGTEAEANQLWLGMGDHYPEAFEKLKNFLPLEEQEDLINAYARRLQSSDMDIRLPAARSFMVYDNACISALQNSSAPSDTKSLSCAVAFSHYTQNKFFIEEGEIIENLSKIAHLPAIIVHGRFDAICRISMAYKLWRNWPKSQLKIIPDAGHWGMELGIIAALVEATNEMKKLI